LVQKQLSHLLNRSLTKHFVQKQLSHLFERSLAKRYEQVQWSTGTAQLFKSGSQTGALQLAG
jgi:hypothetical protein